METMLCDELVQEIFRKLPSTPSVCLVSKRWLSLYRSSKTSLSLRFPPHNSTLLSLPCLLSHYPCLSFLCLALSDATSTNTAFSDRLLSIVSSYCSNLHHLKFLAGPISGLPLSSLSKSCSKLTSITVSLSRPLFLNWVVWFSCLKELRLYVCSTDGDEDKRFGSSSNEELDVKFGLETLCLSGVGAEDKGVSWLWRNCKRLNKLQLKSCESVGDGDSFSSFIRCVEGLEEVELRKCRSITDRILLRLAENCASLNSLLIHDGCSREGLLEFITTCSCRCNLRKLDLRLPLDLDDDHLLSIAMNLGSLSTLRLQSCCLVTGEGLQILGTALNPTLEQLAFINCDVVDREVGFLATLGQNLTMLRKLDLSYNEMLDDKQLVSMLVSCNNLVELKLRGCRKLTSITMVSISKTCKSLQSVDVMNCSGIEAQAVELFVLNCPQLRQIEVEETKVSDIARTRACHKFIEVTSSSG